MIRTELEYQAAIAKLEAERTRLGEHRARLAEAGLSKDELKRVLDPLRSFHLQLQDEVESYERLRRGDVGQLSNLHGLGQMLVSLRVVRGITQRELATRLGVHESQVSRDERNEYHGVTVERASRVLDALEVELKSLFDEPVRAVSSRAAAHPKDR